jgi:hypothetical protein
VVYGVERAIEFCSDHDYVEDALQKSLLGLYVRGISMALSLPEPSREVFRERFAQIVDSTASYDPVFSEALWENYDEAFGVDPT